MTDLVSRHLAKAMTALNKKVIDLDDRVKKSEEVNRINSLEIASLQQQMTVMRNQTIMVAIEQDIPYREIGSRFGLSAGRISQIKKEYMQ